MCQVVASALTLAAHSGKEFRVFLTKSGEKSQKWLQAANIPVTLIEDMAIGYIMNKVAIYAGGRSHGRIPFGLCDGTKLT